MNDPVPSTLATVIRPLLLQVGQIFELPDGILGVALAPDPDILACPHIYFAEFVGPSYPAVVSVEEIPRSSDYSFASDSILSLALFYDVQDIASDLPSAQLHMGPVRYSARDYKNVAQHLDALFTNATPETVLFHRTWLKQRASILYYVPRNQENSAEWKAVVRSTRLVAGFLRTSMVIVAAADRADSAVIQPLIDCLPAVFGDQEARLSALVINALRLEERSKTDVRDTYIEIEYRNSTNQIVFLAGRPDGQNSELIAVQCNNGLHLCGKNGANLIVCDTTEPNAKRKREMKQTLALFMLNKGLSKDPDAPSKVHFEQAYRFFNAGDSGLPPQDDSPADAKQWQDAVRIRVKRANDHLNELLGAQDAELLNVANGYYGLVLRVTRSEAFNARMKSALGKSRDERIPGTHESSDFVANLVLECSFAEPTWAVSAEGVRSNAARRSK